MRADRMTDEELEERWASGLPVEVLTTAVAGNAGAQSIVVSAGIVEHVTTFGNAVVQVV